MTHPTHPNPSLSQADEIRVYLNRILGVYPTGDEQNDSETAAWHQAIIENIRGDLDALSLNDAIAVCVLVGRLKTSSPTVSAGK